MLAVSNSRTTASGVTTPRASGRTIRTATVTYRTEPVDIDRFIVRNAGAWHRLEDLTARARKSRSRSLAPAEIDEFVALYQRAAAQLSHARGYYDDPGLTARLTTLVASAHAALYGTRPASMRGLGRFFTETFPAAVWHSRRFVLASAALMFVP